MNTKVASADCNQSRSSGPKQASQHNQTRPQNVSFSVILPSIRLLGILCLILISL